MERSPTRAPFVSLTTRKPQKDNFLASKALVLVEFEGADSFPLLLFCFMLSVKLMLLIL